MRVMPVEATNGNGSHNLAYKGQSRDLAHAVAGPNPSRDDRVMLIRNRKSRIYFLRQFFEYPIQLSAETLKHLGLLRTVKIGASYSKSLVSQLKPEKTLEQFFIN